MRLSDWQRRAPSKASLSPKVRAVAESALVTLGTGPDPECWIVWGDDPAVRYLILAPSPSGLVQVNVRVSVLGEGPRAGGKVIRWSRVQLGELGVEIQGSHRLLSFQVEAQVLNGVDDEADRISDFAQTLFAAVDGRGVPTATKPAPSRSMRPAATRNRERAAGRAAAKTGTTPATGPRR